MPPDTNPIAESVWVRPPKARRGQPTLSREQIVSAAIELLDAQGLDGLSMRRLGAKLGSGATSVYWYVANKDELIELVIDEIIGEVEIPDLDEVGWRTAIAAMAQGFRAMMIRHLWISPLLGVRPIIGPNAMRLNDRMIETLTAAGFRDADLAHAANLVMSYVIGSAASIAAMRAVTDQTGKSPNDLARELEPYLERIGADYPSYTAWWSKNKNMDVEKLQDDSFGFGLERLLDGLDGWLGRRR